MQMFTMLSNRAIRDIRRHSLMKNSMVYEIYILINMKEKKTSMFACVKNKHCFIILETSCQRPRKIVLILSTLKYHIILRYFTTCCNFISMKICRTRSYYKILCTYVSVNCMTSVKKLSMSLQCKHLSCKHTN